MPELPEVETVCRGLARVMTGNKIKAVSTARKDLRIPFPRDMQSIEGQRVTKISRRAKYILISLNKDKILIIHLGMSGSLVIKNKGEHYKPAKHDHMVIDFDNGTRIIFNDPRRFGLVALTHVQDMPRHKLFRHLGPEPFDKKFSASYLGNKLKSRKAAIKLSLMDQKIVVGVGNIYASESLFFAGIDPRRKSKSLTMPEMKKIVAAVRKVLTAAIRAGGSSLRNYVQSNGELGYFQRHWAVYGKEGQKCKGCRCDIKKTGGVQRLIQGGRASFYCKIKQK